MLSPGLKAGLERLDLCGAPIARGPEPVRGEAERLEQGQRAPLGVRRVSVAPPRTGLRNDPVRQGPQRDAVESGPRRGERVDLQRLAHLFEERDRVRRGSVPLCGPLDLLWRRGVLARLEVLRVMATTLELGESAQTEALDDAFLDRGDGGRVARRHERVGTDPDEHPVAVRVKRHHSVGEARGFAQYAGARIGRSGLRAGTFGRVSTASSGYRCCLPR